MWRSPVPVLILLHSNFRLGAPNSNVALVSMFVVAAKMVRVARGQGYWAASARRRSACVVAPTACPRRPTRSVAL